MTTGSLVLTEPLETVPATRMYHLPVSQLLRVRGEVEIERYVTDGRHCVALS